MNGDCCAEAAPSGRVFHGDPWGRHGTIRPVTGSATAIAPRPQIAAARTREQARASSGKGFARMLLVRTAASPNSARSAGETP